MVPPAGRSRSAASGSADTSYGLCPDFDTSRHICEVLRQKHKRSKVIQIEHW